MRIAAYERKLERDRIGIARYLIANDEYSVQTLIAGVEKKNKIKLMD